MISTSVLRKLGLMLCCLMVGCGNESPTPDSPTQVPPPESNTSIQLDIEQANAIREISSAYMLQIDVDLNAVDAALASLVTAIEELLNTPDEDRLQQARAAWTNANVAYELTAIHRYFADTILGESLALQLFQLDYQLNHWPILPGYIDYVENYPNSGMVNDMTVAIEPDNLRAQHGVFDANEAAIGFHVIEFLLWGEAGVEGVDRSASDYEAQSELTEQQAEDGLSLADLSNNRRREFLRVATTSLRSDFSRLASIWADSSTAYRNQIDETPAEELLLQLLDAMTRMLSEEILVGSLYLMLNGDFQESRPSLFSATSQNAVSAQLSGLERLLLETGPPQVARLDDLLSALSADYADFFLQNFDASKECLVVVYSMDSESTSGPDTEFKVVECINSLTNMIDYLERIKLSGL